MKWLKRVILAVWRVVAVLLVVGLLLPSGFKVQRSLQIAAPPAKIYPLIADPRQWKTLGDLEPARPGDADPVFGRRKAARAPSGPGRARPKATE